MGGQVTQTVLSRGCIGHLQMALENLMTIGYFMKTALELLQVIGFITRVSERNSAVIKYLMQAAPPGSELIPVG